MAVEIKKINGVYMGSQEIASTRFAGDANLKAYYRLESGALTTDSSGNGYTLTNNNTVGEGTGKFGVCADFSSTNSNKDLRITNDLGIAGGAISLSAWVKITTAPTSTNVACIIAQSDAGTNTEYYIRYYNNSGTLQLEFFRGKRGVGDNRVTVNHTLSTTSFTHVALTYDATTLIGYINGVNVGSIAASGNGTSGSSDCFSLGEILGFNTWYLSGLIDDAAVFNDALTSDEITSLYKTGVKKLNGMSNLNPELESTSLRGDANLVQYTRFEGNSTATVGTNGTDTDMTYGADYGKFGQGALFNGTSSKIVTGNCNIGTDFTVSIWVKADGNQILYSRVIENDYANGGFAISAKSTTTWDAGVNGTTLTTFPPIKNGVWNHLALVYNGASITLYSDGVPYSVASTTDPTQTNIPLYIGEYVGGGNYYFKGSMDDLSVFSRALTATEISNLYNTNIKKYNGVSNV